MWYKEYIQSWRAATHDIHVAAHDDFNPNLIYLERKGFPMIPYITPQMEITEFETEDVITTSGNGVIMGEEGDD